MSEPINPHDEIIRDFFMNRKPPGAKPPLESGPMVALSGSPRPSLDAEHNRRIHEHWAWHQRFQKALGELLKELDEKNPYEFVVGDYTIPAKRTLEDFKTWASNKVVQTVLDPELEKKFTALSHFYDGSLSEIRDLKEIRKGMEQEIVNLKHALQAANRKVRLQGEIMVALRTIRDRLNDA